MQEPANAATSSLQHAVVFEKSYSKDLLVSPVRRYVLAFMSRSSADWAANVAVLEAAAPKLHQKAHMVCIDIDVKEHVYLMNLFGIRPEDCPTYRFALLTDRLVKYRPENAQFTPHAVASFAKAARKGNLKPHLLGQEPPADWDKLTVKRLVQRTFRDCVLDPRQCVFVNFYAPWCVHCQAFSSTWEEVAARCADMPDVVFAQMDATQNEVEGQYIRCYPTIKCFRKGDNQEVQFCEERTVEKLMQFVLTNSRISWLESAMVQST
ncbi:Protein disulfide-isomerase [Sparganum proliferum]